MASGETCTVIEFKPNNSRATKEGASQVRKYADELNGELKNRESKVIDRLKSIKSDFGRCQRFEYRVDCYTLCPTIEEDGSFREPRADWRKDCS